MSYYHPSKEVAQGVADQLLVQHAGRVARVEVQMEPFNGWVVRAIPKILGILDLSDVCEVVHPAGHRLTKPPVGAKKYAPRVNTPKPKRPKAKPTPKAAVVVLTGANQLAKPWATVATVGTPPAPVESPTQLAKPWEQ